MDGHHWLMPINCHFRDYKALLVTSLTHVSGARKCPDLYLYFYLYQQMRNKSLSQPATGTAEKGLGLMGMQG